MNPLTQIKNTQKASKFEISQGFGDAASWHARFKHSAYVFAGGLPYDLTEGDLLAVFAQYGELVDVNMVRHKDTGKSRGFAFLAYEDQRSTTLAVDNLSGARVAGRIIRVEHVDNYKRKKAEMEGREPSPDTENEEEVEEEDEQAAPATVLQAAAGRGSGANGAGAGGDAPWANSNSIFSMLREADAAPAPAAGPGEAARKEEKRAKKEAKKAKKEGKQKKDKKHKDKDRAQERAGSPAVAAPDSQRPPAAAEAARQDTGNAAQAAGAAHRSDRRDARDDSRRGRSPAVQPQQRHADNAPRRLDDHQQQGRQQAQSPGRRRHSDRDQSPDRRHRDRSPDRRRHDDMDRGGWSLDSRDRQRSRSRDRHGRRR